ncbi:hypothetical protein [Spirillospora sp. CA-294931]|uniref:hypothetical protein n=1 Tax=Spirillospora sp. CA-294931 TaxID=3240042 RepID=UPI003D92C919
MSKRFSRGVALAGLSSAVFCASSLTPAHAATTYWRFDNYQRGCLTASTSTSAVFEGPCRSDSTAQQWRWATSDAWDMKMLVNRATGRCLTTDFASSAEKANAVWQGVCDTDDRGKQWRFEYRQDTHGFLHTVWGTQARTSPTAGAVYTDDRTVTGFSDNYYAWSASTSTV